MKKLISVITIALFLLSSKTNLFCETGITKEELAKRFYQADDPASTREVTATAFENIELMEEILLTPDIGCVARFNSFSLLAQASLTGLISKERFFNIALHQIANIQNLAGAARAQDELRSFSAMIAYYSYNPIGATGLPISDNFQNALSILDAMFNNKLIANEGILNSIKKKVDTAKEDVIKKDKTPAINKLKAAINEINAQNGKHITKEGVSILSSYINNLIAQINMTH